MAQLLLKIPRKFMYSCVANMNKAKKAAAVMAVKEHVKDNFLVGIGSGSTVEYVVDELNDLVQMHGLKIRCVPTSLQARQLIIKYGLTLCDLDQDFGIDVTIDGADEVDSQLNLIKGGGGCHLMEKLVASTSKKLIIVADDTKDSEKLGDKWKKGIPIEVVNVAHRLVKEKIERELGGVANLRMAQRKAGPVVTDQGNFILDWVFDRQHDWLHVNSLLNNIPGVIETGLFVGMAEKAYFGNEDGTVKSS